ncbi:Protein tincar [Araneus ventricosus]|uniref:Protein tincar n=1 Tax=Araneus ventricosus TaxID=182803 RepID=A0A4Y2BJA0_ARAVE|nr:Protein tincar [Araneus ventricosus]
MAKSAQTQRLVKGRNDGAASCQRPSVNSQWSVWYCVFALGLQIYIMATSIQRFTRYVSLPWPPQGQPYFELNAYVAFIGAAVVLMPFFVILALMKVGNYANDGHKIGNEEPDMVVYQNLRKKKYCRWLKSLWKHGGPLAPLIHLAASMCLLLPKLLVEAQLIKHGFLSKGAIWRTDLDFLIAHKDRLVTLRFISTLNATEVWGQQVDDSPRPYLRSEIQSEEHAVLSTELINYTIALLVYAVRYPAVFWSANKCYGFLFSCYMLFTASQQLLVFAGFTILYKVHICGSRDVLLRFSSLLLSVKLTVLIFFLYSILLAVSGTVLYFYGLQKYKEWVDSRLQCQLIRWKKESRRLWGVAPHLTAFLLLISTAVCAGPLMYDYTLVYCGSLDGIVLAGITGTITHLFLWIVLWLILTIKHKWMFVSSSVSNNLQANGFKGAGQDAPLLVIDHGQTYQVRERDSRKAILNVVHKSIASIPKISPTEDDDIYWLKPKPPPPKDERTSTWHKSQRKSPGPKHKVIFQDGLLGSTATCKRTRSLKKSPKVAGRFKKQNVKFEELSDSDDGDYATLRDMTVVREEGDGEDGILCKRLRPREGDDVIRRDYENLEVPAYFSKYDEHKDEGNIKDFENPMNSHLRVPVSVHRQPSNVSRRTDSGVSGGDAGDISPRSGSVSESSTSPEKGTSESSSGVHSNSSAGNKRSSSMENVGIISFAKPPWKSMSLQRGVVPPTNETPYSHVFRQNNAVTIQRKPNETSNAYVEPFGRATNVRLTSFTDHSDFPPPVINNGSSKSPLQYTAGNLQTIPTHQRRDSANYSLASSAESESSVQHS